MKKIYIRNTFIILSFFIILTSAINNANSPGAGYSNAPSDGNCTSCHGGSIITSSNAQLNKILLKTNFPGNGYVPDSTYTMELSYKQTSISKFGMQLTVLTSSTNKPIGTLSIPSGATRVQRHTRTVGTDTREYIAHTSTGTASVATDSTRWVFTWKAPRNFSGKIKFHLVVMATNNNSNNAGDVVYGKTFEYGLSSLMPLADAKSNDTLTCTNYFPNITGAGTNSPSSYSWKFTGATPATSVDQNPSVKFTSTGTQWAILTVKNTLGTSAPDSLKFLVSPSPLASISNGASASVCAGDSLLLLGNTASNITYKWNPNGKTTKNIFVKDSGIYSIKTTSTLNSCSATSNNFKLNVNAKPTLTVAKTFVADTFCNTFSDVLTAIGTDIDSTLWYENGILKARIKGLTYNYSTSNTAQIYAVGKSIAKCLSINSNNIKIVINKRLFPSNIITSKTTSTINLAWTKVNGITNYKYKVNGGSFLNTTSDSTIKINGLSSSTTYNVTIRSNQKTPCSFSDTTFAIKTNACSNLLYNIVSPARICKGSDLTLQVKQLYKAKYSIAFNNGSYKKDTIFTFTPTNRDSISISIIDSLSPTCPAISEKIGFLLDTLPIDPALSVNVFSCKNSYLFVMSNVYNTYEFYKNGNLVNSGNNNTFLYTNLISNDQLLAKGIVNSCIRSKSSKFTLNLPSSAAFNYTRNWKIYTLAATDNTNTVYKWYANNVLIGTTSPLVIDFSPYISSNASVSLATTNFQTCTDSTNQVIAVPNFTFLNTLHTNQTQIFPNPFSDFLTIKTDLENYEIQVTDMTGKLILSDVNAISLNTQALASGIYLIRMKQNNEIVFQQKMVK